MMNQETKNAISNTFERTLGITYEELIKMDPDDVQELINEYRMNNPQKSKKYHHVMVGCGEHATFIRVKKGKKIMTGYGNFIEPGLTLEESQQRVNDRIDSMDNSFSLVKKLKRKKNSRL